VPRLLPSYLSAEGLLFDFADPRRRAGVLVVTPRMLRPSRDGLVMAVQAEYAAASAAGWDVHLVPAFELPRAALRRAAADEDERPVAPRAGDATEGGGGGGSRAALLRQVDELARRLLRDIAATAAAAAHGGGAGGAGDPEGAGVGGAVTEDVDTRDDDSVDSELEARAPGPARGGRRVRARGGAHNLYAS
jgi:hypothetical protein